MLPDQPVSRAWLDRVVSALADTSTPPIAWSDIQALLSTAFDVDVVVLGEASDPALKTRFQDGATIFPVLQGMSVTFPDPSGAAGATRTAAFDPYATVTSQYRADMAALFAQLAARVQGEAGGAAPPVELDAQAADPEPVARFVAEDYFLLLYRQLVQAAADAWRTTRTRCGWTPRAPRRRWTRWRTSWRGRPREATTT